MVELLEREAPEHALAAPSFDPVNEPRRQDMEWWMDAECALPYAVCPSCNRQRRMAPSDTVCRFCQTR